MNTAEERHDAVNRFNTVPEERVMLISNFDAVGFNATVASIIILFVCRLHITFVGLGSPLL
jgi:hypothetical protein